MSGIVPHNFGEKDPEDQEDITRRLAFAAQRGWFYEEWGNMLKQMKRTESPQAELNKLLIVLEGGQETFETGTIQRGLERVVKPYLALLGCATPHDIAPFMEEGDAWWHDGFWPRFAFAVPGDAVSSRLPRPRESYNVPGSLIVPLANWHARLGTPMVEMTEERKGNGKETGLWHATIGPLPCREFALPEDTYDAYEAYNDALLGMVQAGNIAPDLNAWYVRAHEKALRVAMLLASVHEETAVTLPYWVEGQRIAEEWRTGMHHLQTEASQCGLASQEAKLEQRILTLLLRSGGMTKRELQQMLRGVGSEALLKAVKGLRQTDQISEQREGKSIVYLLAQDRTMEAQ
jgi:hypothetical protein